MSEIETNKPKKKKKSIVGDIISGCFTVLVVGFALYVIIASINSYRKGTIVRFFGYSYSVVGSGSMSPTIEVGDIIIIKNTPISEIKACTTNEDGTKNLDGDIVVYHNSELGINIVHRVVGIDEDGKLITQGDNRSTNPTVDTIRTDSSNYIGKVVKYGPLFGLGSATLNYRNIIFIVIFAVFIVFIIFQVFSFIKEKEALDLKKQKESYVPNGDNISDEDRARLKEELLKEIKEELENSKKKEE